MNRTFTVNSTVFLDTFHNNFVKPLSVCFPASHGDKLGTEKIKKSDGDLSIALERTDDILGWLGQNRRDGQFLCGFSMETQNMLENSRAKLAKKHIDMIVANNLKVEGAGFGTDTNVVTLITRDSETELPIMTKEEVADCLLTEILKRTKEQDGIQG